MSHPPPKPWERRIPGSVAAPLSYRSPDSGNGIITPGPAVTARVAPPVPPRPVHHSYRPSYSSFQSSYSPFSGSPYGGYSPYGYGGYGGGYGYSHNHSRLVPDDVPPSRFVQQAEESSRGAFQSVESVVHAFSSVSMMLDATFSAVYNSFRAVLDVANHLSRLRVHFTKVLSAFALVRTLRYLYRRLQTMLGLRSNVGVEDLWADSAAGAVATAGVPMVDDPSGGTAKSWPIFLFFAVVFGGPYLIWKLLRSEDAADESGTNWANGEDDHVVARAEYDFTAASHEELSVQAGDMLNLAPKERQPRVRGWLLASADGQTTGLVPANYVKILGRRKGTRQAELERLAELQQGRRAVPSAPGQPAVPRSGQPEPTEVFESAFRETPAHTNPSSTTNSAETHSGLGTVQDLDP